MTPENINDLANWPFALGAFFTLITALTYGWPPTPWYRSLLGVAFMGDLFAHLVVAVIIFGRRFFGPYPGYEITAWSGYTIYAVASVALYIVVVYTRRTGRDVDFTPPAPKKKGK